MKLPPRVRFAAFRFALYHNCRHGPRLVPRGVPDMRALHASKVVDAADQAHALDPGRRSVTALGAGTRKHFDTSAGGRGSIHGSTGSARATVSSQECPQRRATMVTCPKRLDKLRPRPPCKSVLTTLWPDTI